MKLTKGQRAYAIFNYIFLTLLGCSACCRC